MPRIKGCVVLACALAMACGDSPTAATEQGAPSPVFDEGSPALVWNFGRDENSCWISPEAPAPWGDNFDPWTGTGDATFVTSGGCWNCGNVNYTCHGDITDGPLPKSAVKRYMEGPLGTLYLYCLLWVTPSGKFSFTCHN